MSTISTNYDFSSINGRTTSAGDRMNDLTMSDFIRMMTAELQNQDPTDPMSNTEMLAQIGQMRQITSNDKLTGGIDSLTTGIAAMSATQTMSLAAGMIGKTVKGSYMKEATDITPAERIEVSGTVDKVSIDKGVVKLHIGTETIDASSITEFSGL
jgi:flagellar basal-body rod modification protein FlgD